PLTSPPACRGWAQNGGARVKNQRGARVRARGLAAVVSVIALVALVAGAAAARTTPHAQATAGFDGKTIKVAGLTFKQNFSPDAEVGAQARVAAGNKNNELKAGKTD